MGCKGVFITRTCFHDVQDRMASCADTDYRKVPKFSDTRNLCCNVPKIQTNRSNLRVFLQIDAKRIAKSEDPDQTAPLGAV